jgi:hypothetical protein
VIANALSDAFDGRLAIRSPVFTPERVYALLVEAGVVGQASAPVLASP